MKSDERIGRLFVLALFSMSAVFIERCDLGFDQLAYKLLNSESLLTCYKSIYVFEAIVRILAILMITYSLDRMLVFLRSIVGYYKSSSL